MASAQSASSSGRKKRSITSWARPRHSRSTARRDFFVFFWGGGRGEGRCFSLLFFFFCINVFLHPAFCCTVFFSSRSLHRRLLERWFRPLFRLFGCGWPLALGKANPAEWTFDPRGGNWGPRHSSRMRIESVCGHGFPLVFAVMFKIKAPKGNS